MIQGTVRVSGLNLMASVAPGEVRKALRKGTRVEILGEETWLRVRTRDGQEGFVFGDLVERDAPEEGGAAAVLPVAGAVCVLERFQHARFVGAPVTADRDFFAALDRIAGFAADTGLFVHVTSSTRDPGGNVAGAIVKPADRSNHLVGHAIDMNLRDTAGRLFTSGMLKALASQPAAVRRFIELVRQDPALRWGGDFTRPDPVHIDDGLNVNDPATWDAKLASRRAG